MSQGDPTQAKPVSSPLDRIHAPKELPPDAPTQQTTDEFKKYDRASAMAKLNPTSRHLVVVEDRIEMLMVEVDRHRTACETLTGELNQIRPRYAALYEAHRATSWQTILTTAAIAIGAVFIGDPDKVSALGCSEASIVGAGWGLLVLGFVGLVVAQIVGRNWKSPFD
ncbi:MAG: hypothetical protein JNL18_16990 [Planctomycetaceae bacterium]|nr:hypothetical protein [Planctomycetaceae bacterium]